MFFDNQEPNIIWKSQVVMNANLSGLKLLHVMDCHEEVGLIQIIESLPALESMIISAYSDILGVDFFREFIPTGAQGISRLNQSSVEGQVFVLCPELV